MTRKMLVYLAYLLSFLDFVITVAIFLSHPEALSYERNLFVALLHKYIHPIWLLVLSLVISFFVVYQMSKYQLYRLLIAYVLHRIYVVVVNISYLSQHFVLWMVLLIIYPVYTMTVFTIGILLTYSEIVFKEISEYISYGSK